MMSHNTLFLHEEIMLLALRDEGGTVESGSMYQYAVSGAVLAELLLNKRIGIAESRKKKIVNLVDSTPVGDPLIDECLGKIVTAKRPASLQTWVSRLAGVKNLKHRVAEQLCKRGILRGGEDKILLIFTRRIYPEVNPDPERRIIERLREAIFSDSEDIDPRTTVLVSLAHNADLLKNVFDTKELKRRKARIKQVIKGEMTGKAAKEAIEAVQAAVTVACIMPAITVAATSS